ncbi:granzyme D-like [Drosophila willistoni]|uniref:granzyme D-like n=1 Tax=Drosophila willistoni TaxID=7260 RepID=UPI001F07EE75|nr:granzyme D-like [Drosophila willistoni]
MKITIIILVVYQMSILTGQRVGEPCNGGICTPIEDCPLASVAGFDNYCDYSACCPQIKRAFRNSPSGRACKKYSNTYCKGRPLITNGNITEKYEFPYMVQVGIIQEKSVNMSFGCGGTLIHQRYVLTAAHCLQTVEQGPMFVRLGGYNTTDGVIIEVESRIEHPEHNTTLKINDIALLKLKTRVAVFNNSIMPACLADSSGSELASFTATGWGPADVQGTIPTALLKIQLYQLDPKDCDRPFEPINNTAHICAGKRNETEVGDVCNADSGGPLQRSKLSNGRTRTISTVK